jgi:5'-nucleotidase/5'-nucleotidase/UDP-sugar diphosphatase
MPFADTIRFSNITGKLLKELLEENAQRINRPEEPNSERGFLQFSQEIRYRVILGQERSKARAAEIFVSGMPLEDMLSYKLRVAYPNFLRMTARAWEIYAAREPGFPLLCVSDWPHKDSDLFLRSQMVAYIQQHGGVTQAGGARRDGRLVVS